MAKQFYKFHPRLASKTSLPRTLRRDFGPSFVANFTLGLGSGWLAEVSLGLVSGLIIVLSRFVLGFV